MLGLARRRDARAIPVILAELEKDTSWCHYVEAAYHLATRALCRALRSFSARLDERDRAFWETRPRVALSAAIHACCGDPAD